MFGLSKRNEWKFFAVLPKADRTLAWIWWAVLILRGVLPAIFAVAMGVLVGAVQRGDGLAGALAFVGVVFVFLQVLAPIHQAVGANLGDRTAAWLYDRLTEACVRPSGMGHLEDPKLTSDLTVARDFDLGMTGPPLSISIDFIAGGLVEMFGGFASAAVLFAYAWWAPLVLCTAWLATHWLLRERACFDPRSDDALLFLGHEAKRGRARVRFVAQVLGCALRARLHHAAVQQRSIVLIVGDQAAGGGLGDGLHAIHPLQRRD